MEDEFVQEMMRLVTDLGKNLGRDHSGRATYFLMIDKAVFYPDQLQLNLNAATISELFVPDNQDELIVGYQYLANEHQQIVHELDSVKEKGEEQRKYFEPKLLSCEKNARSLRQQLSDLESKLPANLELSPQYLTMKQYVDHILRDLSQKLIEISPSVGADHQLGRISENVSSVRGIGDPDPRMANSDLHFVTEENYESNQLRVNNSLSRNRAAIQTPKPFYQNTDDIDASDNHRIIRSRGDAAAVKVNSSTQNQDLVRTQKEFQPAVDNQTSGITTFGRNPQLGMFQDPSKTTGSFRFINTDQKQQALSQPSVDENKTRDSRQQFLVAKHKLEDEIKALETELDAANMQKSLVTAQLYAQKQTAPHTGPRRSAGASDELDKGYRVIEAGLLRELHATQEHAAALDLETALLEQELHLVQNEVLYFEGQHENLSDALQTEKAEHETLSLELMNLNRQVEKHQYRKQQLQLQERKIHHLRQELQTDLLSKTGFSLTEVRRLHDGSQPDRSVHSTVAQVSPPADTVRRVTVEGSLAAYDELLAKHPVVPAFPQLFQKIISKGASTMQVDCC